LARWRATQVTIAGAVIAMPLLRPSGPGNTGLVDLALVGAMFACALWASTGWHRLHVPYALPVGLTVAAGALALLVNDVHLRQGMIALAQDVFVLAWAAAVATVGRERRMLDTLCRVWAYSATGWACVLIVAEAAGITWLSGISPVDGIRASFTLGDPNLAANYFLCGLLVMRACRRPRRTGWRWLACAVVITAIVLTLSNGGMLALLVATVLGALLRLARQGRFAAVVVLGTVLAIGGGAAVLTVDLHARVTRAEENSPLVRDSIGRQAESSGSRAVLVREGVRLWLHGDTTLWGVGPANTATVLRATQSPYVKEAHDDYLATVLERGVLGAAALLLLIVGVGIRCRRITASDGIAPSLVDVVPRPELLVAALAAIAVSAMFYEVLHFRHVWALLGLVAALELSGRRR
jgi:O-antigen ligase